MSAVRQKLEPLITPMFRAYWRVSRGMTLGARVIAQDDAGRVMLVRHTYRDGWFLPGGGVEAKETAEDAARRELAEEGGLAAEGPLTLFGLYANHAAFKNDHVAVYHTTRFRPCPSDSQGEIADRGFYTVEALPKGITLGTRRRLEELFDGRPKSATW